MMLQMPVPGGPPGVGFRPAGVPATQPNDDSSSGQIQKGTYDGKKNY